MRVAVWPDRRLGQFADIVGGTGFPDPEQGRSSGEYPFYKVSDMNAEGNQLYLKAAVNYVDLHAVRRLGGQVVPKGAIVVPKVGAAMLTNKRRIATAPCLIDNNCMAISVRNGDSRFWCYSLVTIDFAELSQPGPVPSVNATQVGELRFAVPDLPTQVAIADFLDREVGRLDEVAAAKRRMIELLDEKRTALITHTVTKGLNPDAPMKETTIPWLGRIPAHWAMSSVGRVARTGSGTTPDSDNPAYYDGSIPWVASGDLNDGSVTATAKRVTKQALGTFSALKLYEAPTLAVAMYGASIGRLGIVGIDATFNQACCVIAPSRRVCLEYSYYWLFAHRAELVRRGLGGTQPNISQEMIRAFPIAVPELEEQREIADALNSQLSTLNAAVDALERQLQLLSEFKSALITAAVTGQLDEATLKGEKSLDDAMEELRENDTA